MPKPKPFRRPSIEIRTGDRKLWQWVPPHALAVGDTVAEFGMITKILLHVHPVANPPLIVDDIQSGANVPDYIELFRQDGGRRIAYPTDVIYAYTTDYSGQDTSEE